jgi:hypothetical protein
MSAAEAAAITDEAKLDLPEADGPVPAFEIWRERIRRQFG